MIRRANKSDLSRIAEILENIWVYEEDEIVKGLIHIENNEVMELYERGIRTCLKEWMISLLPVSMGMTST